MDREDFKHISEMLSESETEIERLKGCIDDIKTLVVTRVIDNPQTLIELLDHALAGEKGGE